MAGNASNITTSAQGPERVTLLGVWIWVIAALYFLYEFFLRTFTGTLADQIISTLNLNAETFALIGSAYYLTYSIMQLPVGLLVDRYGPRKLMIVATILCAISSIWFAYTQQFVTAFITRLFMGMGSSFAFVCLLSIALSWFPRRYFASFVGASQFIGTAGPLLAGGPLALFLHRLHGDWRLALLSIGLAGLALTALIALFVQNKPKTSDSKAPIHFAKRPIPLFKQIKQLLTNRQALLIALYSGSVYVAIPVMGAIWGTKFLQGYGLSQASAASITSMIWLGYALGCPTLGAISDRIYRRRLPMIMAAVLGIVVTLLIITFPPKHKLIETILFFLLGAAGSGQSIGFAVISEHVVSDSRATAIGLNNMAIMLSGAIIPPLISLLIETPSTTAHQGYNFTAGFLLLPLFFIGALIIVALFINESYCKPQREPIMLGIS